MIGSFGDYFLGTLEGAPGHFPVDGRFSGVPTNNGGNKIPSQDLRQRLLFPRALVALGAPGHFPVDGVFLGGVEGFIADMITLFLV